jgi:hypothetical protein
MERDLQDPDMSQKQWNRINRLLCGLRLASTWMGKRGFIMTLCVLGHCEPWLSGPTGWGGWVGVGGYASDASRAGRTKHCHHGLGLTSPPDSLSSAVSSKNLHYLECWLYPLCICPVLQVTRVVERLFEPEYHLAYYDYRIIISSIDVSPLHLVGIETVLKMQVDGLRDKEDWVSTMELRAGLRALASADSDADAQLLRGCGLSPGPIGPGGVRGGPPLPERVSADEFLVRSGIVPRGHGYPL